MTANLCLCLRGRRLPTATPRIVRLNSALGFEPFRRRVRDLGARTLPLPLTSTDVDAQHSASISKTISHVAKRETTLSAPDFRSYPRWAEHGAAVTMRSAVLKAPSATKTPDCGCSPDVLVNRNPINNLNRFCGAPKASFPGPPCSG